MSTDLLREMRKIMLFAIAQQNSVLSSLRDIFQEYVEQLKIIVQ
ncbi:hypothetical protein U2F10_14700 [Leptothoe sp. EHU-05/26/07-4]